MTHSSHSGEPRNDLETVLALVVCQVLGLEDVGIFDNFFQLGGDSMKAADVTASLQELFNCDDTLLWSFIANPTVAALSEMVIENSNCGDVHKAASDIIRVLPDTT